MTPPFTPTFAHIPPGPLAGPLQLLPINAAVVSVHTADGAHVGSLKLVGGAWKFKAMGYDAAGRERGARMAVQRGTPGRVAGLCKAAATGQRIATSQFALIDRQNSLWR